MVFPFTIPKNPHKPHKQDAFKLLTLDFSLQTAGTKSLRYKATFCCQRPTFPPLARRPLPLAGCQFVSERQGNKGGRERGQPAAPQGLWRPLQGCRTHRRRVGGTSNVYYTWEGTHGHRAPQGHLLSTGLVSFSRGSPQDILFPPIVKR